MTKLVETKWLFERLNGPSLVIIDASPTDEYMTMHIEKAVSASFGPEEYISYGINTSYGGGVDLFTDPDSPLPFQDGDPEYTGRVLRSLGINQDSTVVVYDNGASFHATRVFWTLSLHGLKNVHILNGGIEKWEMEGRPVTTRIPVVQEGDFAPRSCEPSPVVDTDYVLENLANPDVTLVDSNLASWYHGDFLAYSRRGHIPYAVNIPYPSYFSLDRTWKSKDKLHRMFALLGVVPEKEIIVYCGGNPAGSSLYFTLRHVLGYPRVKFYLKSLIGWLSDPRQLPVHTYANEHMLRDAEWVRWFAGERIQYLVRDTRVRAVDVRSREDYTKGHIPYAVSLPVDELIETCNDLKDWEEVFGQNGISNHTELVLYDHRYNLTSSLLLWILEYFGHKKVSVLHGGFSGWTEKGYTVSTQPPILEKPRHKFDVAIAPTSYTITPDSEKIYLGAPEDRDPEREDQIRMPILATAGGIERFTDPDTGLKSAGELFAIYDGAGLSKPHDIICHGHTLKEAAFHYFLLRLLGFPRIRVAPGAIGPIGQEEKKP